MVCVSVLITLVRPAKQLNRLRCRPEKQIHMSPKNQVLDAVHIGTSWQIRLNDPCSVAMWAVATTTCYTITQWHYQIFIMIMGVAPSLWHTKLTKTLTRPPRSSIKPEKQRDSTIHHLFRSFSSHCHLSSPSHVTLSYQITSEWATR